MIQTRRDITAHPHETELADYLAGSLAPREREKITDHIGSCADCLAKVVAAHEAVAAERARGGRRNDGKSASMQRPNFYLIGAIIAFTLSFIMPRYFIQLLVATLVLGIKWIVDAKSTKMLIMIYEAWKKGGEKETSKILETFDANSRKRL